MNQAIFKQLTPAPNNPKSYLNTLKFIAFQVAVSASALLCVFSYQAVQAQNSILPQGGTVINGQAAINTTGSQMNVVNTPGAVINWNSFGIGAGAGVNFQQQSTNSSVMNRVTGGNISTIHGNLTSNGRVILINPAGLVIGAGAVVDTAGFVGSALSSTEANIQLDRLRFDASGGAGRIQVDGIIRSASGDIVLIAPDIGIGANALIQAPSGAVSLAAGQRVQLTGRGLDGITLELQAPINSAINLGRIEGEAVGLFSGQLRHSGIIDARRASIEGGRIVLRSSDAITVTGSITADGRSDTLGGSGQGGTVTLEGSRIALQGAQISASGPAGGGKVSVGGGWQGNDTSIRNASATTVDRNSRINVNAMTSGNGGQVVVWSDGDTWFSGTISVQGGASSGNGGRVEVSGKERLGFHGVVNTAAINGQAGSLLLDPRNIYLVSSGGNNPPVSFGAGGTTDFFISTSAITALTGSISLQAANDIEVQHPMNLNASGGTHLVLEAGRSVLIAGAINSLSSSLTDSVTIVANSNNNPFPAIREPGVGVIDMTGGSIYTGNAPGVVKLLVQNGNGFGGGITVTNVVAGQFSAEAVTGINMPPSGSSTNLISANSIFLATMGGNIGSSSDAIKIADTDPYNGTINLSITAPGTTSSAYVGTDDYGAIIRLAPSSINPNSSIHVDGTASISNQYSSILVGALSGETGTANITAGNLVLTSSSYDPNPAVIFSQKNGNTLSVVINGDLLVSATNTTFGDSILIGGPDATGATDITVMANATLTSAYGGISLQHGPIVTGTVRLFGQNNVSLNAAQDIVVKGAKLAGNAANSTVNVSAHSIYVEDFNNTPGEIVGKGVNLSAVSDIEVSSQGSASSLIRADVGGITVTANNLYIDSTSANASQTARIEAQTGGNLNFNITNTTSISGGGASDSKAIIETLGGGTINLNAGALHITSGSGFDSGAAIKSSSDVTITTTGSTLINGSNSNNAGTGISAGGNVNLYVSSLQISANLGTVTNSDYGITATGVVNIDGPMTFVSLSAPIDNPGSNNSRALIRGDAGVNITATYGITLEGGDGFRTGAVFRSNSDINLAGSTSLTGGSGTESTAMITTTGSVNMMSLSTDVSSAGLGSHALIYAGSNSVTVAEMTGQSVATLAQVSPTVAAFAAVIVPNPDVSSSVLLPSSLPAGSTGTGTVTYSNLSGYTVSFTATIVVSGGVTQTTLLSIPPNGTTTIPVVITATASGATVTANLGSVSFGTSTSKILPEALVANNLNTSTLVSLFADISSTVALPASGIPGTTVTGTVTYTNLGAATATFTSTVVIDGVTTTQIISLPPGGSTTTIATILVGTSGNTVTVNAINSTVLESTLTNNLSTQIILITNADIATSIVVPSSAPAGSTVPVTYTFSNNGSVTTTFTPTVVINGVTTTLAAVTLAPGATQSGTQTVMIGGGPITITANVGVTSTPETTLTNNMSSGNIASLLPNISTTIALPTSTVAGSTANAIVTYVNSGTVSAQFTSTVIVNGVPQTNSYTLGAGQSLTLTVAVPVGTAVSSISASASNTYDANPVNNNSTGNIAPLFADISALVSLPSTALAGTTVTGTITYTNLGAATSTFTSTVVINGLPSTQTFMLAPGGSTSTLATVLVGTSGNTVTVNVGNSNVIESNLANNFASQVILTSIADIASSVSVPSSAAAGSTVPLVYAFSNNGSITATFTPTLVVAGVPIALASITLAPGQSITGTQTVMISGSDASIVANVGVISITDGNLVNNISSANIIALLPNISTTIALPTNIVAGNTGSAVVTYVNTGAVSAQFTSTVVVNGIPQSSLFTLAPGQSLTLTVAVPVGTLASVISANANTIYDANAANNISSGSIAPLFADIAATLNLPSTGIAGSTVNGIITYTNLGGATTNFIATVVIDGVAKTQSYSLSPGASTQVPTSILVNSTSNQISVNVGNSSVIESSLGNNSVVALLSALLSDISASISAPAIAAAGSTVPVIYTFSNNGLITTTFTPTVVINNVVTTLAAVTLAPGASTSGTQSVMIGGNSINVAANVGVSSTADSNTANNLSNVGIVALLPNISTTIAVPTAAVAGSTANALVTYINTGTVSAAFTSTVIVNGVVQTNIYTLDAGQSLNLTVTVPVGIAASSISAIASNFYDANSGNNNTARTIDPLFADIATSIISPSTATVGSVIPTSMVYQNFGAATTTFNAAVVVDGVTQTFVLTLAPGAIFTQAVNVSVLPSGATLGAQAIGSSVIESNTSNNSSVSRISPISPIIQSVPITQILISTAGSNTSQALQGISNQLGDVLLGFLNTGSTVQTNNSGDVSRQRDPATESIQTDDIPICRP